jgi:hypothetical protein
LSAQLLLNDCYATHEGSSSLPAAEFLGIPTSFTTSLPVCSVQGGFLQSVVKRNDDIRELESVAGSLEVSSTKRKCRRNEGVERAQLVYGKHQHISSLELFNRAPVRVLGQAAQPPSCSCWLAGYSSRRISAPHPGLAMMRQGPDVVRQVSSQVI